MDLSQLRDVGDILSSEMGNSFLQHGSLTAPTIGYKSRCVMPGAGYRSDHLAEHQFWSIW